MADRLARLVGRGRTRAEGELGRGVGAGAERERKPGRASAGRAACGGMGRVWEQAREERERRRRCTGLLGRGKGSGPRGKNGLGWFGCWVSFIFFSSFLSPFPFLFLFLFKLNFFNSNSNLNSNPMHSTK